MTISEVSPISLPCADRQLLCSYTEQTLEKSFLYELKGFSGNSACFLPRPREGDDCRFCLGDFSEVYHEESEESYVHLLGHERRDELIVHACRSCGWWLANRTVCGDDLYDTYQLQGSAKQYDVSDVQAPLDALRNHLCRNPKHVAHVHPTRFEHLMKDCFKDYFGDCEVIHTGQSGDGGVDLKLITAEHETYLVQVKRREV